MPGKLINPFCIAVLISLIFSSSTQQFIRLQDGIPIQNDAGQPILVKTWMEYRKRVQIDPDQRMVELSSLIPGIQYDLRYAKENNFMGKAIYPTNLQHTFLRRPAAIALKNVAENLSKRGLGIKIFDAYRPYHATVKIWMLVKDERYAANPVKGSAHNRGIAVDLSLIDLDSGRELDMGSAFDNFSDTAHHRFRGLPDSILKNRTILRNVMEENGFRALETEWWHYSFSDAAQFEHMDLNFSEFLKPL